MRVLVITSLFIAYTLEANAADWPKRIWKCSIETLPAEIRNCTRVHHQQNLDKYKRLVTRSTSKQKAEERIKSICDNCEEEYNGTNYQCDEIINDNTNYKCKKSYNRFGWEW